LFIVVLRFIGFDNVIVFFHGWNSTIIKRIAKNCILRHLFIRIFASAEAIIVLAKRFRMELIDFGIPPPRIHVTTTMFSKDIFKGVTAKLSRNQSQLLFLSRIIRDKGIYELVDAFERVRTQFPDLKLTIAGDGPELNALIRYVNEKKIGNSILFTGYVRNSAKAIVFLESDIYILPTYSEGCPVSLLEAMAAGLAVITSPVGGIADIVDDGVNGILLKHPTPSHIATALRRLLSDRKFCETIQGNNRRKAWENYEAKFVTGMIETIYAQVAGHV
jgi:glycosyltransferase involved in cell wall biosynthesis